MFDEAWQAQVLGIADSLVEEGILSREEWARALGDALAQSQSLGAVDNVENYYRSVLVAIEALLEQHRIVQLPELDNRTEEWREAYLRTPHGQPVALE